MGTMTDGDTIIATIRRGALSEATLRAINEEAVAALKNRRANQARDVIRSLSVGGRVRVKPGMLKTRKHDGEEYEVTKVNRTRVELAVPVGRSMARVTFPASVLERVAP